MVLSFSFLELIMSDSHITLGIILGREDRLYIMQTFLRGGYEASLYVLEFIY